MANNIDLSDFEVGTAEHAQALGQQCPECGGTRTESNNESEYRCFNCDHRWGFDRYGSGNRYGFGF